MLINEKYEIAQPEPNGEFHEVVPVGDPTLGSNDSLQFPATLGLHVELGVFNLLRIEVVYMADGSKTNFAPGLAFRGLHSGLAWPGMDADSFLDANSPVPVPRLRNWIWAVIETGLGVILIWAVAPSLPEGHPLLRGWAGMLGLILVLHFGMFQIAALFWQSLGVNAPPIMSAPLRSESLAEFWGKRWNLGFRQLAHDLLFAPLHKKLGGGVTSFSIFVVSGLIHDLVISVPARGGYGLPTGYFVLQGLGVFIERSRLGKQLGLREGVRGWVFMALFTGGPAFWLFHRPFVLRVIIPFMKAIHAL